MGGTCGTHGVLKRGYGVLVGQPEEKSSFRRLGPRWENGIKTGLQEKEWEVVDYINTGQKWGKLCVLVNSITKILSA